jgi:LacI family transcriptional regulator
MPRRHVTLQDVAREAGVHPATASRALNSGKQVLVNAETAARVRQVAERLGYVANPIAQVLRGSTEGMEQVGVLVRTLLHPWVGSFLHGVDTQLSAAGYTPWITYTGDDPGRVRHVVGVMTSWRVGALIIATARVPNDVVVEAAETGVPVVVVSREAPDQICSAVNADDERGAWSAIGHLTGLGHTSIGVIAGPPDVPVLRTRLQGFREAIEASGISAHTKLVSVADDYSVEAGEASCAKLLASGRKVTAIAAANDFLAVGCYTALKKAGLRCPEDVSVIGFDDLPLTAELSPPLTTMRYPGYEMGAEAANLIIAQLRGESRATRRVLLTTALVPRDSTARP